MKSGLRLWVAVGVIACTTGGCPTASQEPTDTEALAAAGELASPVVVGEADSDTPATADTDSATSPADDDNSARPGTNTWDSTDQSEPAGDDTGDSTPPSEPPGEPAEPNTPVADEEPSAKQLDPNEALAAVDFVAREFAAVGALFSGFGELGDPRLNLDPNTTVTWGTCPLVSIASSDKHSLIGMEFGNGCAAACAGGNRLIGDTGEIYWRQGAPSAVYVADGFAIDGRLITPLQHHPEFVDPNATFVMSAYMTLHGAGVTLAGDCDFATQGVGRASGEVTLDIGRQYVLTFSAADLSFDDGVQSQSANFATTVVRPAAYGNFLPDAGLATFAATLSDGSHAIEVQFTDQSPLDGTVNVSIDGGASFLHTLPPELL
jgi:hypothetical protein